MFVVSVAHLWVTVKEISSQTPVDAQVRSECQHQLCGTKVSTFYNWRLILVSGKWPKSPKIKIEVIMVNTSFADWRSSSMLELLKPGAPLRQFLAILPGDFNLTSNYSILTHLLSFQLYMFRCTIVRSFQRGNPAMLKKIFMWFRWFIGSKLWPNNTVNHCGYHSYKEAAAAGVSLSDSASRPSHLILW